jgi:hypothetical protein
MILSGQGSVDGEAVRELSTIYLDDGELVRFAADSATEILLMGMPRVALMGSAPAAEQQRAA